MDQDSIDAITDAIMIEVQTAGVRDQLKRVSDSVSKAKNAAEKAAVDVANKAKKKAQQLLDDARKAANNTQNVNDPPHARKTTPHMIAKQTTHTLAKQNLEKLGRRFFELKDKDHTIPNVDMDAWVKDLQSMNTVLTDIHSQNNVVHRNVSDIQEKIRDLSDTIDRTSNEFSGWDRDVKGATMKEWYGKILKVSIDIQEYNNKVSRMVI
jgi:vacuolar-type H+-ATPase subunit H